jgi:GxxExxY protein
LDINVITERIIGAAIKVHSQLGPGFREHIYEKCLAIELTKSGLAFECQARVRVLYDGKQVGHCYFIDILVERSVVLEIKAVERFDPVHLAQMISYLRMSGCPIGLLLNFNSYSMKTGIKRVVLGRHESAQCSQRSPRQ